MRFLFAEDIFISYSRSDATPYAATLASNLASKGFSCFLDQWNTEPGLEIPKRVLRSLTRSTMLVLVGSPGASRSAAVEQEIRQFLLNRRPIVPISVGGALETSPWFAAVAGASLSVEQPEAFAAGAPSTPVLVRIESSFRFVRRNQRVRRAAIAAAIVLTALTVVASWAAHDANRRLARAQSAELASSSRSRLAAEPDLAALLAVESLRAADTFEARRALLGAVTHQPRLGAVLIGPAERREKADQNSDAVRITDVTFSGDGTRLAATEWQGRITVWNLAAEPIRGAVLAAAEGLRHAQVSADFRLVVGLSEDNRKVHARPCDTGPEVAFDVPAPQEICELALSPDGRFIALGSSDGIVTLWDAATGKAIGNALSSSNATRAEGPNVINVVSPVTSLRFGAEAATLHWIDSSGNRGAAEVPTGVPAIPLPPEAPLGATGWDARGRILAIQKGDGGLVRAHLYKGKLDGVPSTLVPKPSSDASSVACLAVSADGSLIAAGFRNGDIALFDDSSSISPSAVMTAHAGAVTALAISPDGARLVSGSDDGTLMLWRTRTGPLERMVQGLPALSGGFLGASAKFTADGTKLLVNAEDAVVVVDPARLGPDGRKIPCANGPQTFAQAPDGRTLAIGCGGAIWLADLETLACSERPLVPKALSSRSGISALAFSRDGRFLASGAGDGSLVRWDVPMRHQIGKHLNGPESDFSPITSLVFTPSSGALVVGSIYHRRLWPTGLEGASDTTLEDGDSRSRSVALSRDGRLLAGSARNSVLLWDTASGSVTARMSIEKDASDVGDDAVSALAVSAIDGMLAVGQENGRLTLFDLTRQQWLGELPRLAGCYPGTVNSLDFSPDGESLAAVVDGKVVLWPLSPEALARRARQLANRELTPAERSRYVGNE